MKGHLPRAYLRIDPNIYSSHPDPGAFLGLLCAAHMQPWRGRFRDLDLIRRAIGKGATARLLARGDLILVDGVYYVDGWDEWQEGDFTVGERMRRMRDKRSKKRNATVTPDVTEPHQEPSPKPSPPPEASGVRRQAVETETENKSLFSKHGDPSENGHGPLTDEQRTEYAEAVWTAFLAKSGLPETRVSSPGDFVTLKGWMDAGIPLRIVLRAFKDTKGKGRCLAYFAPSVRDAFDYYRKASA